MSPAYIWKEYGFPDMYIWNHNDTNPLGTNTTCDYDILCSQTKAEVQGIDILVSAFVNNV